VRGRALDSVEAEYEQAISIAAGHGDNDEAQWLAVGLRQYRELFKDYDVGGEG
jgi:hypothetical protein